MLPTRRRTGSFTVFAAALLLCAALPLTAVPAYAQATTGGAEVSHEILRMSDCYADLSDPGRVVCGESRQILNQVTTPSGMVANVNNAKACFSQAVDDVVVWEECSQWSSAWQFQDGDLQHFASVERHTAWRPDGSICRGHGVEIYANGESRASHPFDEDCR
jgi:hypothetical protein